MIRGWDEDGQEYSQSSQSPMQNLPHIHRCYWRRSVQSMLMRRQTRGPARQTKEHDGIFQAVFCCLLAMFPACAMVALIVNYRWNHSRSRKCNWTSRKWPGKVRPSHCARLSPKFCTPLLPFFSPVLDQKIYSLPLHFSHPFPICNLP